MSRIASKLTILADAAKYDASCASSGSRRGTPKGGLGNTNGIGICHSYTPDGRCVSLLKLLLTNYCIYDCAYCVNRVSSETPRARFTVEEVVWLTIEFYKRNYIEGLFLSSGIVGSPDRTMDELAEIGRRLRVDHNFGGYIHLKAVPGASPELLEKAGRYADRLSANIELPSQEDLTKLAPAKDQEVILSTMEELKNRIAESKRDKSKTIRRFAPGGQSTQMVIGASPASDRIIMKTADVLYKTKDLKRVYYSAYSPIPHASPILPSARVPLIREHRLYQADWLIRFYGFTVDELFQKNDTLSLDLDPKESWALTHREFFPVDINVAPREMLLRVPGMGVRTVNRIIAARRYTKLKFEDLARMRIPLAKVKYFVTTSDYVPTQSDEDTPILAAKIKQSTQIILPIFSALTGEV